MNSRFGSRLPSLLACGAGALAPRPPSRPVTLIARATVRFSSSHLAALHTRRLVLRPLVTANPQLRVPLASQVRSLHASPASLTTKPTSVSTATATATAAVAPATTPPITTTNNPGPSRHPSTAAPGVDATTGFAEPTESAASDWRILRSLATYLWPEGDTGARARVVIALSLLIAGKLLNVQVPGFFKAAVDALAAVSPAAAAAMVSADPGLATSAGAIAAAGPNHLTVMAVCGSVLLGYGAARVGATLFSELRSAVFGSVAQHAIRRVARTIFSHLLAQDVGFHLARQTGAMTRAIDRGTKGIAFVLSSMVFHVLPTALEIGLVCAILVNGYGAAYAAVTAATLVVYMWFTVGTTTWRTQFRKDMNRADNQAAARATDSLINIEAVKYFGSAARETDAYDTALGNYEKAAVKATTSLAFLNAGQAGIFSVALTAMMWMAAQGVVEGTLTVGDLVMINGLVFQLSMPLNFLGSVYREQRQAITDMQTMFSLQDVQAKVRDLPNAPPLNWSAGNITFENVRFAYPGDTREVLRGVDIEIKAGEKVAFVGPSGCGKSTLVKLLFRLYDPSEGKLKIDGQEISTVASDSLRKHLSIVPQDTALFNNSIGYNIKYGRPDASDANVERAARAAQIHETVQRLGGYETSVGERGALLSGGERQRVNLARALLRDPKLLVVDEGTSALDARTEHALLAAVDAHLRAAPSTSAVFIAHRLASVAACDRIYVMRDGKVVESGRHADLLTIPGGLYREMWWTQQASGESSTAAAESEAAADEAPTKEPGAPINAPAGGAATVA
ncbi:P-loop containing nucleoside triphosphate hydrolase protein [Blastocladiella britannica]|nr:P-loop containing nucleoside triphosphate hydrolase protein [Blastocladiella britannica]